MSCPHTLSCGFALALRERARLIPLPLVCPSCSYTKGPKGTVGLDEFFALLHHTLGLTWNEQRLVSDELMQLRGAAEAAGLGKAPLSDLDDKQRMTKAVLRQGSGATRRDREEEQNALSNRADGDAFATEAVDGVDEEEKEGKDKGKMEQDVVGGPEACLHQGNAAGPMTEEGVLLSAVLPSSDLLSREDQGIESAPGGPLSMLATVA